MTSKSYWGDVTMEKINWYYSRKVECLYKPWDTWHAIQTKSLTIPSWCVHAQASRRFVSRSQDQHWRQSQLFHRRHDAEQPRPREDYCPGSHVLKSSHFQQLHSVKLPVWHAHVLQTSPRWEAGFQTHVPPQPGQGQSCQLDIRDRQEHVCQGQCK